MKCGKIISSQCLLPAVLLWLSGCFSVQESSERIRAQVVAGQYGAASSSAVAAVNAGGADEPFWALWGASTKLFEGRGEEALALLDRAEGRFYDYDAQSFAERGWDQAKWITVNDCLLPYHPVGHDRIFMNLYKGLIEAGMGRADEARVELNRVRQQHYNYLYDRGAMAEKQRKQAAEKQQDESKALRAGSSAAFAAQIAAEAGAGGAASAAAVPEAARARLTALSNEGFPGVSEADRRQFAGLSGVLNPYAAHVCGLFRALNGDRALGDLGMASAIAPEVRLFARDATELASGRAPAGVAWVYVEDGLAPRRAEWRLDLPLGIFLIKPAYTGLALPKLLPGQAAFGGYTALSDGARVPLERLVSVEALVRAEFNDDFALIVMRELVRVAVKTTAQLAVMAAAENRHDHAAARGSSSAQADLMLAAGYAMGVYQALTTAADVRCWALLPQSVYGARVPIPASGVLKLATASGAAFELRVPPCRNAMIWVRCPAGGAPPASIMIPFGSK